MRTIPEGGKNKQNDGPANHLLPDFLGTCGIYIRLLVPGTPEFSADSLLRAWLADWCGFYYLYIQV